MQAWAKAVSEASEALALDPKATKALFRRATAYESLKVRACVCARVRAYLFVG
jgi:hypothetical protein